MKDYKTLYGSLVVGDFPSTVAKNASGPSAVDGTPYTKEFIDDIWGGRIDLMVRASLTPDGVAEANGTSQFVKALHRAGLGPGIVVHSALNAAALALRRYLPLANQVIAIASYPELAADVYCGDTDNPTALGFYRTSDAGGTTRSTTGAYMVLPDARGLVVRGLGTNAKIACANGSYSYSGGTKIAQLLNDMMVGHRHYRNTSSVYERVMAGSGGVNYGGGTSGPYVDSVFNETNNPKTDTVNGNPFTGNQSQGASIAFQICITY